MARVKSRFESEQWLPQPVEKVFAFFADPHNLPRIMPPAMDAKLLNLKLVNAQTRDSGENPTLAGAGCEMVLSFRVLPGLPFRGKWVARIMECETNHFFTDWQAKGPFKAWQHRHEFLPQTRGGVAGTLIRDVVDYQVGFGLLGSLADRMLVRRRLQHTFAWRQKAVRELLRE